MKRVHTILAIALVSCVLLAGAAEETRADQLAWTKEKTPDWMEGDPTDPHGAFSGQASEGLVQNGPRGAARFEGQVPSAASVFADWRWRDLWTWTWRVRWILR